ncbi:LysE family translocator [Actinocrispum wychmicini]|uniref:Threonine/homoserine/homoserine lactone efflux protein n=1 Tax=Actinocrispum wychmicini TaxID=1213861 RepID=A0A4R2J7U7_9PSEU|nr:LysE family translocator [Actinocrispum wychmicini]TCO55241.1 threonine/homoserine/homoserine lactone efflux protein [Actinocrispum wychmicini]
MEIRAVGAFLVVDLLLILTPGADWAYVIAVGVRDRSVVPAVVGLVAGYAGHTLLVVGGLAAVVAASPGLLTGLTTVGAAYLMWLGGSTLVRVAGPVTEVVVPRRVLVRGIGISGLNPKGLLLYLALLPQFVRPGAGWPVAVQTGVLGVLHMVGCGVGYLAVGLAARVVLKARPRAARVVSRASGAAMILIGALLLVERLT